MVALDGERHRPLTEDLDLAGGVRLDPEGRALGSGVAQQRAEHEPGTAHVECRRRPRCLRRADRDRRRLNADLERLGLDAVAAVELVQDLAVELHRDLRRLRRLHERRAAPDARCRARERADPIDNALCVDDTDVELTVVRSCILEHLDAAEQATDIADENAARVADVPGNAVDLDLGLERLRAQVLGTGPDIRGPAESILERAVGLAGSSPRRNRRRP